MGLSIPVIGAGIALDRGASPPDTVLARRRGRAERTRRWRFAGKCPTKRRAMSDLLAGGGDNGA